MFQAHHLSKRFGPDLIFQDITFSAAAGDRVGLVGPNGCGKSTLLRCLAGVDRPDGGVIDLGRGVERGYVPQSPEFGAAVTVGDAVDAALGPLATADAALRAVESGGDAEAYADAYDAFVAAGGYQRLAAVEEAKAALSLDAIDPETPIATLSGGQKTRLALAGALIARPSLLLLDEPTNHLDLDGILWLEAFLRGFAGAVVVASHDRAFLDAVVTRLVVFTGRERGVRLFAGNYSAFEAARESEAEAQAGAWKRQQEYVTKVRADITRMKEGARRIEITTTPRQPGVRRLARKKAALALSREKKLDRFLESEERVERPDRAWGISVDFGRAGETGRVAFRAEGLAGGYGGEPVFTEASFELHHGDRVAVVGPNGAGKTTLLRLLDGRLAPVGGSLWRSPNVRLGTMTQEQETLDREATVIETVRRISGGSEGDARSFLHRYLFAGDSVFRRVGDCSLGERARLQLAALVLGGCNVLILDEPLNHLDIASKEQFEAALDAFPGLIVAVSHDRRFVEEFGERVFEVRDRVVMER
ncbi:MAG: ribosomal protection-like ABC-F family protein [Dehalococcoidia bacterium]